jgi:hypothetical protein
MSKHYSLFLTIYLHLFLHETALVILDYVRIFFFEMEDKRPSLCINRCIRRLFNYLKYCLTKDYIMGRSGSIHESTI